LDYGIEVMQNYASLALVLTVSQYDRKLLWMVLVAYSYSFHYLKQRHWDTSLLEYAFSGLLRGNMPIILFTNTASIRVQYPAAGQPWC